MKRPQVAVRLAAVLASLCWVAACLPAPYTTADDLSDVAQLAADADDAAEAPDVASGDLSDAKPSDAKSSDAKPADIHDVAPDLPDVASAVDADDPTDVAPVDDPDDGADDAQVMDAADDLQAEDDVVSLPEPYTGSTAPATILFIGNSYTYTNDLPGMFIALLGSTTPPLPWKQDSVVAGAATLQVQATSTGAMAKIAQGGWTWVVLQGQSVEPACWPDNFVYWAKILAQQVKTAKAKLAYFSTWPRKVGSTDLADPCPGATPAAMFAKLKAGYQQAADQTGGLRVPVGDAWMQVVQNNPEIELYNGDLSHPSVAGTYLTACVFAKVLVGIDPQLATLVPEGISLEQALILRKVAAQIKP